MKNLSQEKSKGKFARINPVVFWGSVILCVLLYAPMMIYGTDLQPYVAVILKAITYNMDWLWLLFTLGCVIFSFWLAFGKYGNVKLGGTDDKPEFSDFSWLSMMFTGGVGAGLVYWSMAEPLYYLKFPPYWNEAFSGEAAQFAIAYGMFHWGLSAWAIFVPGAITFAYMLYVRKKPYFSPSYACRGVLGDRVDGWLGKAIDIFVVLGLVGGLGTTLGTVIPMMSAVAAGYLGIPDTMTVKVVTTLVISATFTYSAVSGINSGIKKLSELNSWLCMGLLAFVAIVGPTLFLFSFYVDNLGVLITNFFRMSLYTDPITKSGFPQDWTVFYWAWWAAWAMYFGLFVARISKGRTIKNVVLNMMVVTSIGCSLFFLVFGGYAVNLQLNLGVALDMTMKDAGAGAMISQLLHTLPGAVIVIPYFLFVMLIFQATTIDTNAYIISSISCKEVRSDQESPQWTRLFWCALLAVIGLAIMMVGGLPVIQLSSVATSVPIIVIIIILSMSLLKWLKEDFGKEDVIQVVDYPEED
nr:BCCT family transporter [Desulfosporosinus fructosivorans]